MSVGYSVLNKELNISGDLIYRAEADIRITNVRLDSVSNTVESFSPNFSKDEVIIGFNMGSDTSTITYKIEVTNYSDVEMGILKIEGLPSTYEIKDYTLKTKLVDTKGNSKTGMVKEFSIVLKANTSFKGIQNIRLKLDFEPIYTITYSGFNNTSNYIKEIIKGEAYSQNLGTEVEEVLVTAGNVSTNDYVLDAGKLEIKNIDGNILIENTTPNAPVLNGDMIPVYYEATSDTEGIWRKADINNIDNNWYDYKTQKWANAVTVNHNLKIKDLSENKNDGIVYRGMRQENDEAYFNGVSDYINCGLKDYNFKEKNQITMVLRFRLADFSKLGDVFGNWEKIGGGGLRIESNMVEFNLYDDEIASYHGVAMRQNLNNVDYFTLVGSYDGNNINVYLNGVKATWEIGEKVTFNSSVDFAIGGNPSSSGVTSHSKIFISDALIFDEALSDEEILTHYSDEVTLGDTKPLLYYDFSEPITSHSIYDDASIGTTIPENDMSMMWVWVPRYSYTIKSEDSKNYYGKASFENNNPTRELPGEIDVKFINTSLNEKGKAQYTGSAITNWRTNEAFNFDNSNNVGMWITKFEIAGKCSGICVDTDCDVSSVTSRPGNTIITNKSNANFFYMARSMQVGYSSSNFGFDKYNGDLHMIKNDEWGAVAYLSQSRYGKFGNTLYTGINKKIYVNSNPDYKAGRSNGDTIGIDGGEYRYNNMTLLGEGRGLAGPGASTTGTVYGIYDMNGGGYERVMALIGDDDGPIVARPKCDSGFNGRATDGTICSDGAEFPSEKYYNLYKTKDLTSDSFSKNAATACNGIVCYGHALSETYGNIDGGEYGWYNDYTRLPNVSATSENMWLVRGGRFNNDHAGIFNASNVGGGTNAGHSTRFVLVQ